jgi:hypothetical protein
MNKKAFDKEEAKFRIENFINTHYAEVIIEQDII